MNKNIINEVTSIRMKRIFYLIILTSFLYSCIDIRFENAMPLAEKEINIFPEKLIGEYEFWDKMSETNNIALGESGRRLDKIAEIDKNSERKKPLTIDLETFDFILTGGQKRINKEFYLKQLNDTCFFISIPRTDSIENIKSYNIIPFTLVNDILTIYLINDNNKDYTESIINRIEDITPVQRIQQINSWKKTRRRRKNQIEKTRYYLINPDDSKINLLFEKRIFNEWMYLKKI